MSTGNHRFNHVELQDGRLFLTYIGLHMFASLNLPGIRFLHPFSGHAHRSGVGENMSLCFFGWESRRFQDIFPSNPY